MTRNAPRSFDGVTTRATYSPGCSCCARAIMSRHRGGVPGPRGPDCGVRFTVSGEMALTVLLNCEGKAKYIPVTAHMAIRAPVQMPAALCKSQFTRFQLRRT